MNAKSLFFAMLYVVCLSFLAEAQIPRTLSYQGALTDSSTGERRNGEIPFIFRLYDAPVNGTALWDETKTLIVAKGLFSTILGDQTPFGASLRFDKPYWLGIQVEGEQELSPRMPLTSVGYSMSSLRADTAMVSLASIASGDTTWQKNGSDIYRPNGNVGIGTSTPASKLDLSGGPTWTTASWAKSLRLSKGSAIQFDAKSDSKFGIGATYPGNNLYFFSTTADGNTAAANYRMVINANGNVGIGTTGPSEKLHVAGSLHLSGNHAGSNRVVFSHEGAIGKQWELYPRKDLFQIYNRTDRQAALAILNNGNVGIGTNGPDSKLHVQGTTTTKVLAITGGADIAEPFEISHDGLLRPGTAVVIDQDNPGNLKQATEPYDKRVAGVISGAGGINPGLTLVQEGLLDGGQHVALTGKVYALATAINGPIQPGDLLTTSEIPGHAMKATDQERSFGAVIGKAMSRLTEGEGLVLVLIQPH